MHRWRIRTRGAGPPSGSSRTRHSARNSDGRKSARSRHSRSAAAVAVPTTARRAIPTARVSRSICSSARKKVMDVIGGRETIQSHAVAKAEQGRDRAAARRELPETRRDRRPAPAIAALRRFRPVLGSVSPGRASRRAVGLRTSRAAPAAARPRRPPSTAGGPSPDRATCPAIVASVPTSARCDGYEPHWITAAGVAGARPCVKKRATTSARLSAAISTTAVSAAAAERPP